MSRLSVDAYFLQICEATAQRSTCPKAKVGAILVSPRGEIRASGYNGSPRGWPHCEDVGCILDAHGKCLRVVHAEINALMQAHATEGCTLYCTHLSCLECAKASINAGILRFVYRDLYIDPRAETYGIDIVHSLFAFSGITSEQIGVDSCQ